jgi:hypothetical protein
MQKYRVALPQPKSALFHLQRLLALQHFPAFRMYAAQEVV